MIQFQFFRSTPSRLFCPLPPGRLLRSYRSFPADMKEGRSLLMKAFSTVETLSKVPVSPQEVSFSQVGEHKGAGVFPLIDSNEIFSGKSFSRKKIIFLWSGKSKKKQKKYRNRAIFYVHLRHMRGQFVLEAVDKLQTIGSDSDADLVCV